MGQEGISLIWPSYQDAEKYVNSFVYLTSAFSYEEGALVPEASCEKTQEGGKLQHSKRASRAYIPSAKVGSRLPHMLVRELPASSEVCPFDT
jgi:hypothetical protein